MVATKWTLAVQCQNDLVIAKSPSVKKKTKMIWWPLGGVKMTWWLTGLPK
jgi:hypothetical protein